MSDDYTKLIKDARTIGVIGGSTEDVRRSLFALADAVESLVAENEKLLDPDTALRFVAELRTQMDGYQAERDALRAQLDSIRTALTKDRVIMVEKRNGYRVENYANPLVPVKSIEAALEVTE